MFFPLPADTVLEAKARSRRNTRLLFFALAAVYVIFFHLIFILLTFRSHNPSGEIVWWEGLPTSFVLALCVAAMHFFWAWQRPLSEVLSKLEAVSPDSADQMHKRFIDIVEEAQLAIGSKSLQAVVIPSGGCNAFSIEDKDKHAAIGVTEGLLATLNRSELSAVIAHEAAHLAHDDSRVMTTACCLFSVFDSLCSILVSPRGEDSGNWRWRSRGGGRLGAVVAVALLGKLFTKLLYTAISRNREYLADSDAVHLCKDPLSLAGALNKISGAYRGSFNVPEGFSAVFIMNPSVSELDETSNLTADLFSTHPPAARRIEKLKTWAHQDFKKNIQTSAAPDSLYFQTEGQWSGPVSSKEELTKLKGITPLTWIAGPDLMKAGELPELKEYFDQQLKGLASKYNCPRCQVALMEMIYEGAPIFTCAHCQGSLLKAEALGRIVVRRFKQFTPEEFQETKAWYLLQKGNLNDRSPMPAISCPACRNRMFKSIYTESTRVIVDRCTEKGCFMIWCDAGELERIQALVEKPVHTI